MMSIEILNENCFETMASMQDKSIDVVLTSPPYNTNKKQGKSLTIGEANNSGGFPYVRYDLPIDVMTNDEYCEFTEKLFLEFDRILSLNGVVIYNLSYGNNNTDGMFKAVAAIIDNTPFTIADVITWKKKSAMPNNCSPNRLTRIVEYVFVFCRKSEKTTFHCNKKVKSVRKTGQKSYENIFNYIEARNNDGQCPYNKCTFSSELVEKLLAIYAPPNACVYDPFIGSGTTAVACKKMGFQCVGSELSHNQVEFAKHRIYND